jgi:hypothetical protein
MKNGANTLLAIVSLDSVFNAGGRDIAEDNFH